MVGEYPHKNIKQVMRAIRAQIIDSVEYCANNIPVMETPRELWQYLKDRTTFKHDPENVELLQTAQTLFENNVHKTPGAGDCDCFTILVCAAAICQNWPVDIVLAGRTKKGATHIYTYVYDNDGQRFTLDLTEPLFNSERPYKFTQVLPVPYSINKILAR